MADAISAYVRGSTYLPAIPPLPLATVTKLVPSMGPLTAKVRFCVTFRGAYIDHLFQTLTLCNIWFNLMTDLKIKTSDFKSPNARPPQHRHHSKARAASASHKNTVLTLPMCGPGADFEGCDQKTVWKATNVRNLINFVDFAGGSTLYQEVNITGVVLVDGVARETAGGIDVVEIHHQ